MQVQVVWLLFVCTNVYAKSGQTTINLDVHIILVINLQRQLRLRLQLQLRFLDLFYFPWLCPFLHPSCFICLFQYIIPYGMKIYGNKILVQSFMDFSFTKCQVLLKHLINHVKILSKSIIQYIQQIVLGSFSCILAYYSSSQFSNCTFHDLALVLKSECKH